jgi:hypothetical protein
MKTFVLFVLFVIQKLIADSSGLLTIVRFAHQLTTDYLVCIVIELILSPTAILFTTSMPETTWPKLVY